MPGNSSSTKCVQHRRQQHEVVRAAGRLPRGSWMMRGSERGARTIAMPPLRPKASLPSSTTTTLRLLLRMRGNGCAGSRPSGDSTGSTSSLEVALQPARLLRVPARRASSTRMPASSSAGRSVVVQQPVLLVDQLAGLLVDALQRHARRQCASGSSGAAELLRGAARRPRGSRRTRRGWCRRCTGSAGARAAACARSVGLRQHAEVELELRQLAVEVAARGRARSRGRRSMRRRSSRLSPPSAARAQHALGAEHAGERAAAADLALDREARLVQARARA